MTAGLLVGLLLLLGPGSRPLPGTAGMRGGQIVASIRAEPRTFNGFIARDQTTEVLTFLMQGRLVRVNRATFELEPWLADT